MKGYRQLYPSEIGAILAGLRLLQRYEGDPDIMTNGGECAPLDAEEIDELCEVINCDRVRT